MREVRVMAERLPAEMAPFAAREQYRFDHIGIIVRDLARAAAAYGLLGFGPGEEITAPAQGIRALVLATGRAGETLEIFTPLGDGPVRSSLEKRGEGLHHIAFAVPNIVAELARLRAVGVRLVDETPRPGLHGWPVAFIHPNGGAGVLIELVQPPPEGPTP